MKYTDMLGLKFKDSQGTEYTVMEIRHEDKYGRMVYPGNPVHGFWHSLEEVIKGISEERYLIIHSPASIVNEGYELY